MKKIFALIAIVFCCCLNISAQQTMRVNKTDGSALLISINEIESVDFPEGNPIALNQKTWYMHPGQALHLEAKAEEEGIYTIVFPEWTSENPQVATIDQFGVVTAVGNGTTKITASFGGSTESMTVHVTSEKAFDISVADITNTSCTYRISPKGASLRYYYNMRNTHGNYSIDNMDEHGSLEENLYYFTKDWYQFVAEQYGDRSWNEAMQPQLEEGPVSGYSSEFYSLLEPGTEYKLYAIAFDADGNITAPIETLTFETTSPQQSDITFDITIDKCLSTNAMFTVNPSNNDPYFVMVQKASYVEWYVERDRLDDMAKQLVDAYAADTRYPSMHTGSATLYASDFVNVKEREDYYVIVFGYDEGITSGVTVKHFRTESGWTEPENDVITVTPPAGLTEYPCSFDAFDIYADENDEVVKAPLETMDGYMIVQGNKVYFYGMLGQMTNYWTMGTYDAATKTLTMPYPQNLGTKDLYGEGEEAMYLVGGDDATGNMCNMTFHYNPALMEFTLDPGQFFVVNGKPFDWHIHMMLVDYKISLTQPLF